MGYYSSRVQWLWVLLRLDTRSGSLQTQMHKITSNPEAKKFDREAPELICKAAPGGNWDRSRP